MDREFLSQNWMGKVSTRNLNFEEARKLMQDRVQMLRCSGGIDKCLIMIGGLPGSGKTSFASDLHTCCIQLGDRTSPSELGWETAFIHESDFFLKQGIPFSMELLEGATIWTHNQFEDVLKKTNANIIVVECIHLTPELYDFYVECAKARNVPSLWVQFVCDNAEEAEMLRTRADLHVPHQVVANWYNTEYYDLAFDNSEEGLIPVAPKWFS